MPSIESLLSKLHALYPSLSFEVGKEFRWLPQSNTIEYNSEEGSSVEQLLHEVGHAALEHSSYTRDIELVAMERDAWQYAKTILAPKFDIVISAQAIEDSLDTYRDWLHMRSTCPKCNANGIQTESNEYTCVVCRNTWTVNQAIGCQLKRYNKKHPAG